MVVSRGGTGDRNYSNGKTYYGNENRGYDQERPDATPMVTFTPNPAQTPGIAVNDSSVTKVRLSFCFNLNVKLFKGAVSQNLSKLKQCEIPL